MTTPRPRLNRETALAVLDAAGFPSGPFTTNTGITTNFDVVFVAVATAESSLFIDAQGPPNPDGTIDYGFIQINSRHGFDSARLLSDAAYTAACGLQILLQQGVRAWAAYAVAQNGAYPYARWMPPGLGGPDLAPGSSGDMVRSLQTFLNTQPTTTTPLEVDGGWAASTTSPTGQAVKAWKVKNFNDGSVNVNGRTWAAMGKRGLR